MLGELISAGTSIIGGLLGQSAAKKDRKYQLKMDSTQVQRRVADSLAAGVHPLFGLGASVSSPAPVLTGQVAEGFTQAGQNLGRAVDATRPAAGRALSTQANALAMRRAGLENTLIEEQILSERARRVGSPPPYPGGPSSMPGQGDLRVRLPGGGEFTAGPTDYEALEKRYGEPADLYGAMMMAKHATDADANWSATERAASDVGNSILKRLFTVKFREGSLADRRATKRSAWMRRDPNGPSTRPRLSFGRR